MNIYALPSNEYGYSRQSINAFRGFGVSETLLTRKALNSSGFVMLSEVYDTIRWRLCFVHIASDSQQKAQV